MANNDKVRKRENFLDIMRVAATLAVVLLHTITGIMDTVDMNLYPLEKKVFLVALDMITWCVPVFVLISGYLFLHPAREISFGQMLKKYCRRIVLALLLFGAPYACLELIMEQRTFRIQMVWESVLMVLTGKSWSHMWYLYLILGLYLMTPALKHLLKRIPGALLYGILLFLLIGSSLLPFLRKLLKWEELVVLPDGCIYLFYYLCGYLFAVGGERKGFSDRRILWYGAICLMGALLIGMIASRLVGGYNVQMAYNYPFTVLLSLLFMWVMWERENKLQGAAFWKKSAALCFAVYLVHPVFANIYYKFLHITPLNFPVNDIYLGGILPRIALSLPFFFLIILLPSVLAAWVMHLIVPLRKYVL